MMFSSNISRGRALTSLGAVTAAAAFPNAAFAADLRKLKLAIVPTEVAAQGYYANDAGFFAKNGLSADITALQNGPAIISAVLSGSIDIGYSNIFSVIVAHDKGLPINILYGTDLNGASRPTNGLLSVLKSSPIKSAKDLAEKTIGVSSLSNTNLYAVKKWIDTNGGDSKLSKYVEVPLPEMASTVSVRRVDAASMDSANLASNPDLRLLGDTYHAVSPRFIAGVWFATSSWIGEHPADVKNFVASIRAASDWANKNHDAAVKIYAKYSRFTLADLQLSPRPTFVTSTRADLLQPVIDLAAQYGAIKAAFPAKDLLSSYAE